MQQQRDFSLHGAVDLGARKAAAQRVPLPLISAILPSELYN